MMTKGANYGINEYFNSYWYSIMVVLLEHIEQKAMPKKFKVETPMGSLESDSGNHFVDVISVLGVIAVIYFIKKLF
jgi:hypothetical protein